MIDTFGRTISYLRLSVTDRCNLRCRYCMSADGICKKDHNEMLTEEETVMAVSAAARLGVSKLRITGGEPLLKQNILSVCERTAGIPGIRELSLTTNGILLPEYAQDLKACGVKRINLSLDTLNPEKYRYLTRTGSLDQALRGLDAALSAGFEKVKINTVLIGGCNDDEIGDLAALTQKYPVDVRFIELMPMYDGGDFGPEAYIDAESVLTALNGRLTLWKQDGVATLYRMENAKGCIGLIRPISENFCASCNRLRLTADGRIKPCLHAAMEIPVKGMNEEEMLHAFERAATFKPEWHGVLTPCFRSGAGRNMNEIGG
ncbi:MAG: GTP 3',8-cyclase MoaA [Lachnospiraceae bacterium]|nr:GTP 3',8-cyclase MoaA [Lachnospiraceae bacterium]